MEYVVLFISPDRSDAMALVRMLAPASVRLDHSLSVRDAQGQLQKRSYGAILTEAQLPDGDWTDVLSLAHGLPLAPAVIVTHRVTDDRFWAEVLNLGAYDLLVQPFDASEVQRILAHACDQTPVRRSATAAAAGKPKSISAAQ